NATTTVGSCTVLTDHADCGIGSLAAGAHATVTLTGAVADSQVPVTATVFHGPDVLTSAALTIEVEQPIAVTSLAFGSGGPGTCTLSDAILAANSNAAVNGCRAGSPGGDIILLPAGT